MECITGVGSFPYRASHINQVYVGRGGVAHSSGYITPLHLLVHMSQARGLTIIENIENVRKLEEKSLSYLRHC